MRLHLTCNDATAASPSAAVMTPLATSAGTTFLMHSAGVISGWPCTASTFEPCDQISAAADLDDASSCAPAGSSKTWSACYTTTAMLPPSPFPPVALLFA